MDLEVKSDMLAFQWDSGPWDFELMFSLEPSRWALPIAIEYTSHGGTYHGYECRSRVLTLRMLCVAIHFSFDRTAVSAEAGHEEG